MSNLLSAGVYRLLRSKVFYVCLAACSCWRYFSCKALHVPRYIGMKGWNHLIFYIPSCFPLPAAAFCGLFFGAEYSSGTLRSKFTAGMVK